MKPLCLLLILFAFFAQSTFSQPTTLPSSSTPVVIGSDTLFRIAHSNGRLSAQQRAHRLEIALQKLINDFSYEADSVAVLEEQQTSEILYHDRLIHSVIDADTTGLGISRAQLTENIRKTILEEIAFMKEEKSKDYWNMAKNIGLALLIIVIQVFLFRLVGYLYRKQKIKLIRYAHRRFKPFKLKEYELLNLRQQSTLLVAGSNLIRWAINLIQLLISIPMIFIIFPQTEKLARTIFSYIFSPVKQIFWGIVNYIPNVFTIAVIWLCIRYLIKGIEYMAKEIESGKLKISGFYADWARPTYNILRFLLYAFLIAMIYPYLPGSDKGVFQGVSVFLGLMVSLGSTAVIGNIVAGMVITYMRPFKLGDRIKLNDTLGDVVEKTPFVTRIKTPKNEIITIPNSFILSTQTINYSASAREHGLIIHSTVTIGYDAPWRTVHALLISAAAATKGVEKRPEPFVLETELSDFYVCYQINAYIKNAARLAQIYSELHQNIQDKFNEAGVEIMSPHYRAERDGSPSTIPTIKE